MIGEKIEITGEDLEQWLRGEGGLGLGAMFERIHLILLLLNHGRECKRRWT